MPRLENGVEYLYSVLLYTTFTQSLLISNLRWQFIVPAHKQSHAAYWSGSFGRSHGLLEIAVEPFLRIEFRVVAGQVKHFDLPLIAQG